MMKWIQRRICWPNPDAKCLEGKCMFCNDYPFRNRSEIEKYVRSAGKPAIPAWNAGVRNKFWGKVKMR